MVEKRQFLRQREMRAIDRRSPQVPQLARPMAGTATQKEISDPGPQPDRRIGAVFAPGVAIFEPRQRAVRQRRDHPVTAKRCLQIARQLQSKQMMAQQQSHRGRALGTIAAGGAVQPFHLLRRAFAQKGADIGQPFEAALFALASALFTMTVYDRVVPNNAIASLIALSIGLAIIILFDFVLKLLRAYFIDHAGAQIDREMGEEVFERLLAMRFRYPGATEKALDGISFTIQPGEHVALLGRVGSGKSTIARLILGLYPPEDGLIMVDGTDVRQFDPASLRGNFGAVMQDGALLTGSVRENVSLGREAIDDDEMLRVCGISGTHQFLGQIANGYDLKLADRGEGLSGGQRQSIAIARALAGSPQIVVFDEPTSAMDAHTETGLIQRLQDELKGRTLVLITHRPPLLELVDRIILLDKAKIIADGPRDAVLKQITRPKAA